MNLRGVDPLAAKEFLQQAKFYWHEKFELAEGVFTPGVNDIDEMFAASNIPEDLTGMSVLDIGSTNGASAFIAEARGAFRVVAVDIYSETRFGFRDIKEFLGSKAEFVQDNLYSLPSIFNEGFDVVICWGVLYHLRHPVLGLDCLRQLTNKLLSIETTIADAELDQNICALKFYRQKEYYDDGSNWFNPTSTCLKEMLISSGFDISDFVVRPNETERYRALVGLNPTPGRPEFQELSYEVPLVISKAAQTDWYPEEHGYIL